MTRRATDLSRARVVSYRVARLEAPFEERGP